MADQQQAEKLPPFSEEAERAVLGAILLEPSTVADLGHIRAESFYRTAHREIFQACRDLWRGEGELDLVLLKEHLAAKDRLTAAGGVQYLAQLLEDCPTAASATAYAEIVRKRWRDRQIITACGEATSCMLQQFGQEEAISKLQASITDAERGSDTTTSTMAELVTREMDLILDDDPAKKSRFIPTGVPGLDSILTGFCRQDLILIAGRPSCGKTALALQIADEVARDSHRGGPVAFGSVEMADSALIMRSLAYSSGVEHRLIRQGKINGKDISLLNNAAGELYELPIMIDDDGRMTPAAFWALCRRAIRKFGKLALAVVDYLQLMHPDYHDPKAKRHEIVGGIGRTLKGMAKSLDVPVLALCQLSRKIEDRAGAWSRPRLSDLRESGELEQHADDVLFLWSKDEDPHKEVIEVTVTVGKQRNGPVGDVKVMFNKARQRFYPVEEHYDASAYTD